MTISNQNYRNEYTLNESRTSFPYTFKISADSDLLFRRYDTNTGTFTTLTLNSDYTVTGAGVEGGGTITYAGAASYDSDYKVIAERNVPYTQTTDLINNDDSASFNETLEDTFDRLTMLIQQLLGQQDRTLKLDASVSTIADIVAITAGYLYWNGTSFDIDDAVETDIGDYPGTIDAGLDSAKSASPSRNDLYFAYDSNKLYKCLVNGSWSNVWVLGDTTAEDLTATSLTVGDTDSSGDVTISGNLSLGGNITISGVTITGISTDGTLAANSDSLLSSMKSIKTYANSIAPNYAIGTFTRDISLTGNQEISGVGFEPRMVIFINFITGNDGSSWGFDNGTNHFFTGINYDGANGTFSGGQTLSIYYVISSGNFSTAYISAKGSDGFTLTWAKTGSPTGTLRVFYLAFK